MTPRHARVALGGFFLLAVGVTSNALYLQGAVSGTDKAATSAAAAASTAKPSAPETSRAPKTAKVPAKAPEKATVEAPAAVPQTVAASASQGDLRSPPQYPQDPQGAAQNASESTQALKVRMVRVATIGEGAAEEADADTVRAVQEQLNRQGYGPVEADGVMRPATRAAIMAFEQDHRLGLTGEASQDLLKQLVFGTPEDTGAPGPSEVRSPHAEAIVRQVQQLLVARGYRPGAVDGQLSAATVAAVRTFETDQGLVPKGRVSVAVLERLQTGIGGGGRHPPQ